MPKKPLSPQKRADRALCPVVVASGIGMKVQEVAKAMRAAGVTESLTLKQARAWRDNPHDAPQWYTALLAERAARRAQQEHRNRQDAIEHEHRMLLAAEKVERRLLAGAKNFRDPHEELMAQDMAWRASKEMCRAHSDTCGDLGDPVILCDLDIAALRWAGIDPHDHSTWILHRGDCPA
jgi:hypothetical protein